MSGCVAALAVLGSIFWLPGVRSPQKELRNRVAAIDMQLQERRGAADKILQVGKRWLRPFMRWQTKCCPGKFQSTARHSGGSPV